MDRPDGFALKSRHVHQRHGGVFKTGTAGDCTVGDRSQDAGDRGGTERQAGGGLQLRQADLPQDGFAQAPRFDRVGEGQWVRRSESDRASSAECCAESKSEDAGILRAGNQAPTIRHGRWRGLLRPVAKKK
jgi:hypothetical protein